MAPRHPPRALSSLTTFFHKKAVSMGIGRVYVDKSWIWSPEHRHRFRCCAGQPATSPRAGLLFEQIRSDVVKIDLPVPGTRPTTRTRGPETLSYSRNCDCLCTFQGTTETCRRTGNTQARRRRHHRSMLTPSLLIKKRRLSMTSRFPQDLRQRLSACQT